MMDGINLLATNLGMSFENILLFVMVVGSLIFFAKDFKIGLVFLLLCNGGLFLWFYVAGWFWIYVLIALLLDIVILSFSLYAVSKFPDSQGGLV